MLSAPPCLGMGLWPGTGTRTEAQQEQEQEQEGKIPQTADGTMLSCFITGANHKMALPCVGPIARIAISISSAVWHSTVHSQCGVTTDSHSLVNGREGE
jgi:hypothetical protein